MKQFLTSIPYRFMNASAKGAHMLRSIAKMLDEARESLAELDEAHNKLTATFNEFSTELCWEMKRLDENFENHPSAEAFLMRLALFPKMMEMGFLQGDVNVMEKKIYDLRAMIHTLEERRERTREFRRQLADEKTPFNRKLWIYKEFIVRPI